jgi:hypothetical protein
MKRRLMNGVAGTLALSVALAAGGAANATTRAYSAQRHSPTGPRPSAYRTTSTSTEPIEASATRTGRGRTTAVAGSRMITRAGITFAANGTGQPPVLAQNSARLLLTGCVIRTTAGPAYPTGSTASDNQAFTTIAIAALTANTSHGLPVNASEGFPGSVGDGLPANVSDALTANSSEAPAANVRKGLPASVGEGHGSRTLPVSTAVLARSPSLVALNGCAITTDGTGASGVVSAGRGSFIRVANSTIRTNAAGSQANAAHGALATSGGHVALDNVNVRTAGPRAAALASASDGTVIAHGGSMSTDGSPVIRSAGLVQVFGVKGTASGTPAAAVVEGHGTIDAVDTELTGSAGGIVFTGSSSGADIGPGLTAKIITADAAATDPATLALTRGPSHTAASQATLNLIGGSLTALVGPAFEIRRTNAKVAVRSATVIGGTTAPDRSVATSRMSATAAGNATAADNATGTDSATGADNAAGTGNAGGADSATSADVLDGATGSHANRLLIRVADGGRLAFSASGGALSGDVVSHGATALALRNGAALTGAINGAALDLDSSSTWSVSGTSTLTALTGATVSDGTVPAITGNGHDVYYDPDFAANDWLGGAAYPLTGGGTLRPRPAA